MPNVDLSDYAGLLIFGIFIINILLAVAGYKMNGKESAIASGVLAVVGMWIGLGIVNLFSITFKCLHSFCFFKLVAKTQT